MRPSRSPRRLTPSGPRRDPVTSRQPKARDGDRAGADALFRRATMEAGRFLHSPPPRQDKEPSDPVPAEGENGAEKRAVVDPKVTHEAEALSLLAMIHARAGNWASAERTFATITPEDQQNRVTAFRIACGRARSRRRGRRLGVGPLASLLITPRLGSSRPGRGDLRR